MLNDVINTVAAQHSPCDMRGHLDTTQGFWQFADVFTQMVWAVTNNGTICHANRQWACFCGNQHLGNPFDWRTIVHPEDGLEFNYHWDRLVKSREPLVMELRLRNFCAGEYRWFLCHGTPMQQPGMDQSLLLMTATDIHIQKSEIESLVRSLDELHRTEHARDEFIAAISHELRTPLNSILGWTQLMQMNMLDAGETRSAVDCIEQNSRSLAQLVEDMFDVTRAVNNKLRIDLKTVDVRLPVWDAIETVRPLANAERIALHVNMPEQAVWVSGDESRLRQIVWNILSNAVKFTDSGGSVQVTLQASGQQARLSITDTGRGIAPEMLTKVFDRFVQADSTTTRKQPGIGLGLPIVKHLVELHSGTVFAHSEGEGKGTSFTVVLPQQTPDPAMVRQHVSPRDGLRPDALKDVKVIVIDDEPFSRELISIILRKVGAQAKSAGSAPEAQEMILAFRPNVIVCDIGMPNTDGYTLIRDLRATDASVASTPAIALTGYASLEDRTRALAAGFNKHVAKPVTSTELVRAVLDLARPADNMAVALG